LRQPSLRRSGRQGVEQLPGFGAGDVFQDGNGSEMAQAFGRERSAGQVVE
jgi:hypothetical protein